MVALDLLDEENKKKILRIWKEMSDNDKAHFINQVALGLSIWGSDPKGKRVVVEILKIMSSDGTGTLADFGLYIEEAIGTKGASGMDEKIKRAALIIEGYRIKNSLPSEPHRALF